MKCPICCDPNAKVVKKGYNYAVSKPRQRFYCQSCRRGFSENTGKYYFKDKKRQLYRDITMWLCSGVSQRRIARNLGIHKDTVALKIKKLGNHLSIDHLKKCVTIKAEKITFDEMETFEHSKCKPLSIALAVNTKTRQIIAAEVASMPAKGKLAKISRYRYGYRTDRREAALGRMIKKIKTASQDLNEIKSDENPRYPKQIFREFKGIPYMRFKGRRGCVVGQGELKRGGFDPLFTLNHTAAMLRCNIKRLSRRTWTTTKRARMLQWILDIYIYYHNETLLAM